MLEIYVADTTLFHVAAQQLGDATQWQRIATLNELSDPVIVGLQELSIPSYQASTALGTGS